MGTLTLDSSRQHQLVNLRRPSNTLLTEFELALEVAEHSGYSAEDAADRMKGGLAG